MWNLLGPYQRKVSNDGFTILECIISIAIISLITLSLFSLLKFANLSLSKTDYVDEILLNGKYALEYIKSEVNNGDKIICSSKFEDLNLVYPNNIGFVIMVQEEKQYIYSTYYKSDDKLIRIACSSTEDKYLNQRYFKGYNMLCNHLYSLEPVDLQVNKKLIELKLNMGNIDKEILEFKSSIYTRCPVEF